MIEKVLTVKFRYGICARPAAMIASCSEKYRSAITFIPLDKTDLCIDGHSVFDIVKLCAFENSQLVCRIEGEDEQEAMVAMEKLFEDNFGFDEETFN